MRLQNSSHSKHRLRCPDILVYLFYLFVFPSRMNHFFIDIASSMISLSILHFGDDSVYDFFLVFNHYLTKREIFILLLGKSCN